MDLEVEVNPFAAVYNSPHDSYIVTYEGNKVSFAVIYRGGDARKYTVMVYKLATCSTRMIQITVTNALEIKRAVDAIINF